MNWNALSTILQNLYAKNGVLHYFVSDELYLRRAFYGIEYYWLTQYRDIDEIKYVMISEAPLWGINDAYFYNPDPKSKNSSFFTYSDLVAVLKLINRSIVPSSTPMSKQQIIDELRRIGFIILDVFPFAFNGGITQYFYDKNYTKLKGSTNFTAFLNATFNHYLSDKLDLIFQKKACNIKFFYRYQRVSTLHTVIEPILLNKGLITSTLVGHIPSVHGKGYYLDQSKLSLIFP